MGWPLSTLTSLSSIPPATSTSSVVNRRLCTSAPPSPTPSASAAPTVAWPFVTLTTFRPTREFPSHSFYRNGRRLRRRVDRGRHLAGHSRWPLRRCTHLLVGCRPVAGRRCRGGEGGG